MKRQFQSKPLRVVDKFYNGQRVLVTAGARKGLTGTVQNREYIPILKVSRWRVEFDDNWGRGLIGEDDLEAI